MPGQIIIGSYGSNPLVGAGILFWIHFDLIGGEGSQSEIAINNLLLNEGFPITIYHNGIITVSDIPGCLDSFACNFNPFATIDNENCQYFDCNGECGGIALTDCVGICNGIAQFNECGICTGGSTGNDPSLGLDECGVCFGQGMINWYNDSDQDGLGDSFIMTQSCDQPENYVDNSLDVHPNCQSNIVDECGVCDGEGIQENECDCWGNMIDCNGICGGGAIIDECGECDGNGWDLCDEDEDGVSNIDQWGYGAYNLIIEDVQPDQGNWIYLSFDKSVYDTGVLGRDLEYYHIQRNDADVGWVNVASAPAYGEDSYIVEVHTFQNCTETEYLPSEVRVIASMEEGNFVSNESAIGCSWDNIFPSVPNGLNYSYNSQNQQVTISWNPNFDNDFQYFSIMRNSELLASTITPEYIDVISNDVLELGFVEYKISSTDLHGNTSISNENILFTIIDLDYGNSLISFPSLPKLNNSIELLEDLVVQGLSRNLNVNFLISQGIGLFSNDEIWSGNLNQVNEYKGYWINSEFNELEEPFKWVIPLEGEMNPCQQYQLELGNNLCSYTGNNFEQTLIQLGSNLELHHHFNFVIGQGVGIFNHIEDWGGNLNNLYLKKGYWLNVNATYPYENDQGLKLFRWGIGSTCPEPESSSFARQSNEHFNNIPSEYRFTQSTEQAFYLIKEIEEVEKGDLILAFCNDNLVGSVEWAGAYTPVPVMGKDISPQSEGFCNTGDIPQFKLLTANNSQLEPLVTPEGSAPDWSSLGVFTLEKLTPAKNESDPIPNLIPENWSLAPAYPNPFNPVTTIEFGVPAPSHNDDRVGVRSESLRGNVKLQVYDINGRQAATLLNRKVEPGFHKVEWNADGLPGGIYFVKLETQNFTDVQKVLLIK